jgi:ABC-type branched-subunit amino acid transport system permease subunit
MAMSSSLVAFLTTVGVFAMLAIGLNIKFGYTGLLEIGHVAFYLIGGYTTALLVLPPAPQNPGQIYVLGLGWPWLPAVIVGTLTAGLIGALVSLPAVRLREDYLAIALLGIAFIIQQVFRSPNFRWLANGPRALAGFERPLNNLFPLPGDSVASVLLFAGIVFLLWTAGTYALAKVGNLANRRGRTETVIHALLALATLGAGYLFGRWALRSDDGPQVRYALAAGVVVGGATFAGLLAVPNVLREGIALLVLGSFSVFTWVFGGTVLARHFQALTRRDHLSAVGLMLGFLGALVPLVLLGKSDSEVISMVGLIGSTLLVAAMAYALYRLGNQWSAYSEGSLVRIVGMATVWLFLFRYWIVPIIGPLTNGRIGSVFADFTQNLFWLLRFDANLGIVIRYDRFLFFMVLGSLALVYYISEVTVTSPFGRVLKAVREDEDVAAALGKNTFLYKVQGMALGSAIAGLAGAFTAIQFQALTWSVFRVEVTFIVLLMVIIGGTANNRGAILGAVIYWAFARGTTDLAAFFPDAASSSILALRRVIIGVLLIIILYYRPGGIWGERHSQEVFEE